MAAITLPAAFRPRSCQLNLSVNQRVSASLFGGSEQAIDMLNDRWMLSCELPAMMKEEGAWREAFIASMRGQVNTVNLWHFTRPHPRGTARGYPMTTAGAAQGASSVVVNGVSPSTGTLLAGDMLGLVTTTGAPLLVMVASDCTAVAGTITVPLVNRLRVAVTSESVTWDKPTVPFRMLDTSGVGYVPGMASATSFDFGEKI